MGVTVEFFYDDEVRVVAYSQHPMEIGILSTAPCNTIQEAYLAMKKVLDAIYFQEFKANYESDFLDQEFIQSS